MALLAHRAAPPIVTIVALVALTLMGGHGPSSAREDHVIAWPVAHSTHAPIFVPGAVPEWRIDDDVSHAFRDARPWSDGGMVMGPPATHDRIVRHALTDLLSGLFAALRGLAA